LLLLLLLLLLLVPYNRDRLVFQGSRFFEKGNKLTKCCLADVNDICCFVTLFTYGDQGLFSITQLLFQYKIE
jgi:hypothetical protein